MKNNKPTNKAASKKGGLNYAEAGVSIAAGDALVRRLVARTEGIGGFSGVFPLETTGMKQPVLLASTDGVGTKLLIAREMKRLDTIGIDLVAMVVNDLLVGGGRPLFFLDYYATGKLDAAEADAVLAGILRGCEIAKIPLLGGETAEMPGLYSPGDFDLAGFAVALADRKQLITGDRVRPGDTIIGVASSGVHSNGYSLVRAIAERSGLSLRRRYAGLEAKLGEALLEPTRIYSRAAARVLKKTRPTAMAHITGGGLAGNLIRVLPKGCCARIVENSWDEPPIFGFLRAKGDVAEAEMRRVFNLGVGLVVVCRAKEAAACLKALEKAGEIAWSIGDVAKGRRAVRFVKELR